MANLMNLKQALIDARKARRDCFDLGGIMVNLEIVLSNLEAGNYRLIKDIRRAVYAASIDVWNSRIDFIDLDHYGFSPAVIRAYRALHSVCWDLAGVSTWKQVTRRTDELRAVLAEHGRAVYNEKMAHHAQVKALRVELKKAGRAALPAVKLTKAQKAAVVSRRDALAHADLSAALGWTYTITYSLKQDGFSTRKIHISRVLVATGECADQAIAALESVRGPVSMRGLIADARRAVFDDLGAPDIMRSPRVRELLDAAISSHDADINDADINADPVNNAGQIDLLCDSHHGVYIPQIMIRRLVDAGWSGISAADIADIERGPEDDQYWDIWDRVLNNAEWKEDGDARIWRLHHDGDLFAVSNLYTWEEC